MSQPVTTNPLIIMLINMTVVFIVLVSLSLLIRLIHAVDPTRKKEAAPAAAPVPAPVPTPVPEPEPEPEGLSAEVVAAITAAVTLCGFSSGAIRTIRPLARDGWKNSGRALR